MNEPLDQLETSLKQHGYSLTQPRRAVFLALQNTEPITMQELTERCQQVDRASIYRTIDLFEQLHILQRLQLGWKYKLELTGCFQHHHHHASCEQCGLVLPLPEDDLIETRLADLARMIQFDTHDHQLEIRGLCHNCQQGSKA